MITESEKLEILEEEFQQKKLLELDFRYNKMKQNRKKQHQNYLIVEMDLDIHTFEENDLCLI